MSASQGDAPGGILVVCAGMRTGASVIDLIRSEGYEAEHASSLADAGRAFESSTDTTVVVLNNGSQGSVRDICLEAKKRFAGSRLLVFLPDGEAPPADWEPGLEGRNGDLWLRGTAHEPANAKRIRRFLQGEGYHWGSDLAVEPGLCAWLVDGVSPWAGDVKRDEARKLLRFTSELSRCSDLITLVREAVVKYLEIVDCEAGSIYLWDPHTEKLTLSAAEGPEQNERLGLEQRLGEGLAGWVAEAGEPMLVTDTRKVRRLRGHRRRRYPTFACIAAPIKHREQLLGVVCLTMPSSSRPFVPGDLQLLQSLSQKLGALMQLVMVLQDLRQFNESVLSVEMTCSNLLAEQDTQVEARRVLSSDVLDGIPLGIIAYDRRLRVRFANAAAVKLIDGVMGGPTAQERLPLEGKLDLESQLWREKLLGTVEEMESFRLERVVWRDPKRPRVLDIHGCPMKDSDGVLLGGMLTVQDVSADVEMEARVSSAERLALVGTIAAKVAHALNNPLDGMHRFLGLALRQIDERPDKARSCLAEVRGGLVRMGNIVGQLLAFSRRHHTAGRNASLSQILWDVVVLYEEQARAAGVNIAMNVPPDLPPWGGAEMIDVFSNLIKNALDAMPEGGCLTVTCSREDDGMRFAFSDTGPGVPEEIRESIFEPFFTTKRDGSGTGLGLAACRDSMNRIGGSIALCESEHGARFEVLVPAAGREKE